MTIIITENISTKKKILLKDIKNNKTKKLKSWRKKKTVTFTQGILRKHYQDA